MVILATNGDVQVLSGVSGAILKITDLRGGHDLNNDGIPDLLVARPGLGLVNVLDGVAGQILATVGISTVGQPGIALIADVDGDQISDPAVGEPNLSRVRTISGANGALLWQATAAGTTTNSGSGGRGAEVRAEQWPQPLPATDRHARCGDGIERRAVQRSIGRAGRSPTVKSR